MDELRKVLKNWIPEKILSEKNELLFKCLNCRNLEFSEPFFNDTLRKFRSLPANLKQYNSVVTAGMINEWAGNIDFVPPSAFVFHVSRCGSTLVSQCLGLNSEYISLSEVPLFDQVLRLAVSKDDAMKTSAQQLFRSVVKIYGAKRTGAENRLFIKNDCWHLMFCKQLRSLYPDTPFVIMYRSPAAVIESNRRTSGLQCINSFVPPDIYGMEGKLSDEDTRPDNYFRMALDKFYRAIIEIATVDSRTLLLNYNEGLPVIMSQIAAFTGTEFSAAFQGKILERGAYHAKKPGEQFVEKNTAAECKGIESLEELYNSIEKIRVKSR